jgi:lipopolysaccharide assembly outer membrane protein LptD (OstA)
MRWILVAAAVVGFTAQVADGQTRHAARFTARSIDVTGTVNAAQVPGTSLKRLDVDRTVHLRGEVMMTTDAAVVHADEADYDPKTREAVLRGDVRIEFRDVPIVAR